MTAVTRPVLRYHGGKFRLAPWLISLMPRHTCYVEPYGGGAGVLIQKPRVAAECYNDLDGNVVNVFRILRDPATAAELCRRCTLTPFSRAEFDWTYQPATDPLDAAHKAIVRSFMGHGSDSITRGCRTGFRAKLTDKRSLPSAEWSEWPASIQGFTDRLIGVVIENRPAIEVINRFDSPQTLFYCDPPYITSSRSSLVGRSAKTHGYRHEMTDEDHMHLAEVLHELSGMVMLSGYRSSLYNSLYSDWHRVERTANADSGKQRIEVVWFNDAAARRVPQSSLFSSIPVAVNA